MKTRRSIAFCLLFFVSCFLVEGCNSSWRKKFIRKKKKEVAAPQAFLVLQPDHKAVFPPDVRYRQHYAFWKSWHGELLGSLGQIHKRDLRTMDGVIGELRAMQADLSGPPAERLKEILVELSHLQDEWESSPGNAPVQVSHRTRLEKLRREISKKFHYSEVKESIVLERPDPSDD
ncbi:MAG: hypothetical protein Q7J69_05345 [Candidatus Omnitrophota bacterium]|nr:hypothetical protein [Candidatus Omnitrophota bacterium]